ncbi:MAG: Nif11 family protein [Lentisphaeria bacterium]|nr:Nif11 family protein [Lentisphaeria bacterium]MBQ8756508.1 Nif11 family protein [Lentisphaeria bacterium]
MSKTDVSRFYELLSVDRELAAEAMTFQQKYSSQEEVIGAFIELAARQGLYFTDAELVEYIFENGQEVRE